MLTSRRLLSLFVAAVLVIGGAWWLASYRQAPHGPSENDKVLPGLKEQLNDVTGLRVVTAGDVTAVTLRRMDDKRWGVVERGGYSADRQKLSRLLRDLGSLETVEEKTATPARYARLGVEDVKDEKATGVRIDLAGTKEPVSLIVGNAAGGRGTYVRLAGAALSLLAQPQLTVEREPANWLERDLLDIPMDRVQEIRIELPKSRYTVSREKKEQADFNVSPLPKGRELSSPSAPNPIAGALSHFTFDDVSSLAATTIPTGEHSKAEYRLFDGTIVAVNGTEAGDDHWITVSVGFDEAQHQRFAAAAAQPAASAGRAQATQEQPAQETETKEQPTTTTASETTPADETTPASGESAAIATADTKPLTAEQVKQESEAMAKRFDGWLFRIPAYKYETLFQPLDDLLKAP